MVSLPFKLLLFVLVDGWGLVVTSLVGSYTGAGCRWTPTPSSTSASTPWCSPPSSARRCSSPPSSSGFVVSLLQSVTQIQEVTLSFVPKADRRRRRAARLGPLDDLRAGRVHPRPVRAHPVASSAAERGPDLRRAAARGPCRPRCSPACASPRSSSIAPPFSHRGDPRRTVKVMLALGAGARRRRRGSTPPADTDADRRVRRRPRAAGRDRRRARLPRDARVLRRPVGRHAHRPVRRLPDGGRRSTR